MSHPLTLRFKGEVSFGFGYGRTVFGPGLHPELLSFLPDGAFAMEVPEDGSAWLHPGTLAADRVTVDWQPLVAPVRLTARNSIELKDAPRGWGYGHIEGFGVGNRIPDEVRDRRLALEASWRDVFVRFDKKTAGPLRDALGPEAMAAFEATLRKRRPEGPPLSNPFEHTLHVLRGECWLREREVLLHGRVRLDYFRWKDGRVWPMSREQLIDDVMGRLKELSTMELVQLWQQLTASHVLYERSQLETWVAKTPELGEALEKWRAPWTDAEGTHWLEWAYDEVREVCVGADGQLVFTRALVSLPPRSFR
jgi:hypothetical protein